MVITGSKVSLDLLPKSELAQKIGQQPRFIHVKATLRSKYTNTQSPAIKTIFTTISTRFFAPIASHLPQTTTTTIQIIAP